MKDVKRIRKQLIQWYQNDHRALPWRESDHPYHVWLSEVMLQQTQVKTVIPYYQRFLSTFPTIQHLAQADLQSVLKQWEGLGYYARARNFHRAVGLVVEEFGGRIPSNWEEFRQLPGVGDYIASAVLSIAFNEPYAVLDGNVKRVLARMFKISAPVNQNSGLAIFQATADKLLDRSKPGVFNQAVMELGAMVCRPKHPRCDICPLQTFCTALRDGSVSEYPQRIPRNRVPQYHIAVGVVYQNDRVLITRRPMEGLLGGLWEFPGGKIVSGENPASACQREIREEVNLEVAIDEHLTQIKHAYSHFKILVEVFRCRYLSGEVELKGPVDYRWVKPKELNDFPFPKANLKFMHLLEPK